MRGVGSEYVWMLCNVASLAGAHRHACGAKAASSPLLGLLSSIQLSLLYAPLSPWSEQ